MSLSVELDPASRSPSLSLPASSAGAPSRGDGSAIGTGRGRRRRWLAAVLALVLAGGALGGALVGCGPPPQRPFVFTTPQMAREPVEALATAMRDSGYIPVHVDGAQGLVQGRWDDTRHRAKPLQEKETTVVRRFTAKLDRGRFGHEVTLSVEAQRCVINSFTLTETDVTGTCEPLARVPKAQENELRRLGNRLQQLMQVP